MLSRISNLGGGKFGVESAISNLEFGGWKIWGGKCYLESPIFGVENLGWKMLSRISNLEGGWKIWGGICYLEISNLGGGGKFGVENAISNLEFGGVENFGRKILSRISNVGEENLGW